MNNINSLNKSVLRCSNCKLISLFQLDYDCKNKLINLNLYCENNHKNNLNLNESIISENLLNNDIINNNLDFNCFSHENNKKFGYCLNDKKNICKICLPFHKNHNIINFNDNNNLFNLDYDNYLLKLKDIINYIEKLKKIKNFYIEKIENLTSNLIKQYNLQYLFLKNLLLLYNNNNNYYKFNYEMIINIKTNFNLKFPILPENNLNKFIKYLNNEENKLLINYNTSVFFNENNNINFNISNFQTLNNIECKSDILTILNLHQNQFAIGFKDGKIRIYNQISFKRILTIKAHKNFVFDIILFDNKFLISCGRDNKINIININNFSIIDTLIDHTSDVLKLIEFKNNKVDYLISCSEDNTIIIRELINEKFNVINIIKSEYAIFSILQIKLNEFIYLTGNIFNLEQSICGFFNVEKNETIKKISSNFSNGNHSQILLNNNLLCLGCMNNTINIININDYNLILNINLFSEKENVCSIKSLLYLNDNYFMCGNYEGTIIICKIENEKIKIEKIIENNNINCINSIVNLDNNLIISGGNFGLVIYKY